MQDVLIDLLKQMDIAQLVALLFALWFFYSRLDHKIEKLKTEAGIANTGLKQEIDANQTELKQEMNAVKTELKQEMNAVKTDLKQEMNAIKTELKQEINRLGEKVEDVDRRLCRIEGSLSSHGHCLFNQVKPEQQAQ